jgi:hypothetical protein
MSRSGYSDECDGWDLIRWRGAVNSAIKGKRGQAILKEMLAALDAMPIKRLGKDELVTADGDYCALGVVGNARGIDMESIDPEDSEWVAQTFGIAKALAKEIMWMNDEVTADDCLFIDVEICGPMRQYYPDYGRHKKSVRVLNEKAAEQRWMKMREWVAGHIFNRR